MPLLLDDDIIVSNAHFCEVLFDLPAVDSPFEIMMMTTSVIVQKQLP